MAVNLPATVTGAAITGLTTPTFGVTADTAPDVNSKQWAVTTLGGTQTGTSAHSPDNPFTFTVRRPKTLKTLGVKNPVTGAYATVPVNEYKFIFRKGLTIDTVSGQKQTIPVTMTFPVPAGAAIADTASLNSLASFIGGVMAYCIQGLVDTQKTGIT